MRNEASRTMRPFEYKWAVVIVTILGSFMAGLDITIVNLALAHLSKVFDATINQIQWVVTGYLLAVAVVIPSCGYLADRFGMKRIFLASLTFFTAASVASGLAPDLNTLILLRVLQGIGGGALAPLSIAMVMRAVPAEERGKFMGIVAAASLVGPSIGPTVGGLLVDHASWRWIFLINLPVGLIAILLAALWLREQKVESRERFDLPGLLLSASGFALLIYAISEAPGRGWGDSMVVACVVASSMCLAAFVAVELRTRYPILDLRLLVQRDFALGNGVTAIGTAGFLSGMFLLALFLQQVQGHRPTTAALMLIPSPIAAAITTPLVGRLYDRYGPRWLASAGVAIAGLSTAVFVLADEDTGVAFVGGMNFVRGVALALFIVTINTATLHAVKQVDMARASALFSSFRQLASSLGVAITATLLFERGAALTAGATGGLIPGTPAYDAASRHAQLLAFHEVFIFAGAIMGPALVIGLLLRAWRPRAAEQPAAAFTEVAPAD